MVRILFLCHGNICRSPMAEFVFRDMVRRRGLSDQMETASAALHRDAIGCPPHRGTREKLAGAGISTAGKVAVLARREDYERYDYLIGMDEANRADINAGCDALLTWILAHPAP